MSICPRISFPGEKSNWKIQLPSEGCLENAESWLGELDYPGNITMKTQQTNELPPFSTETDLPSRLNNLPSLVQETVHINTHSSGILLLLKVFVTTSISSFFISGIVITNQFSNFKLLLYLWYFAGRLLL